MVSQKGFALLLVFITILVICMLNQRLSGAR